MTSKYLIVLYSLYYISIEKFPPKIFAFKKIKERWVRVLDVCVMKRLLKYSPSRHNDLR